MPVLARWGPKAQSEHGRQPILTRLHPAPALQVAGAEIERSSCMFLCCFLLLSVATSL